MDFLMNVSARILRTKIRRKAASEKGMSLQRIHHCDGFNLNQPVGTNQG